MRRPGFVIVLLAACRVAAAPSPVTESAPPPAPPSVAPAPVEIVADGTCTVDNALEPPGLGSQEWQPLRIVATYVGGRITRVVRNGRTTEFTYDARGRLLRERHDDDAGNWHLDAEFTYVDGPGDPVILIDWRSIEFKTTCTVRLAERTLVYENRGDWRETYDRDGRLVGSTYGPGTNVRVRAYDDATRTLHETRDAEGDGAIDFETFTVHDAAGLPIRVWGRSPRGSGSVEFDSRTVYSLDAHGRVKRRTTTSTPPSRIDDDLRFEYDERGNLVRETRVHGGTAVSRYDGVFAGIRCADVARPAADDDAADLSTRVWRAQIRDMMRDPPP